MSYLEELAALSDPYQSAVMVAGPDGYTISTAKVLARIVERMQMAEMTNVSITGDHSIFTDQELQPLLSSMPREVISMVAVTAASLAATRLNGSSRLISAARMCDPDLRQQMSAVLITASRLDVQADQASFRIPLCDEALYARIYQILIDAFSQVIST